MILNDDSVVKNRGDAPENIFWQGRQWVVTDEGLEARDGTYFIDGSRLSETRDGILEWPMHMGEKTWLDQEDFATAFMIALTFHGVSGSSKDDFKASIYEMRKAAR